MIALAMLSISALGQENTSSYWFNKGVEFYSYGSYDLAEKCFDKTIEQTPKSLELWSYKVDILGKLGKLKEALNVSEKAIEIDPLNASVWSSKGIVLAHLSKYDDAMHAFDNAIMIDPQNAVAWYNKGFALAFFLDRYNESIQALDKATELNPLNVDVWYVKAVDLTLLGKYNESIQALDKAIELNPNLAFVWNFKGINLDSQRKYNASIQAYDKSIQAYDEFKQAPFVLPTYNFGLRDVYIMSWNNKGNALYYIGKYNESIQAYDKTIQIDPKWATPWNNKGNALDELGKYEEAIKCYDKAIEADPSYAMAFTNKGWALFNIGKYNESTECHDKGIEITPIKPSDYGSSLHYLSRINISLAKFYLSDSEEEATSILDRLGLRYVSTDYDMLYGMLPAVAVRANKEASDYESIKDLGNYMAVMPTKKLYQTTLALLHFIDGSSLGHFRLIYESHTVVGQNSPTSNLKIFEYVPGALIKVSNAPGQKAVALLNMTSNQGRKFIYVNEGISEVRVPYSTEKMYGTYAITPYLVVSANNSTNMRRQSINVTEEDVIHGRVIEVNLR